jgi:hypothetical protein
MQALPWHTRGFAVILSLQFMNTSYLLTKKTILPYFELSVDKESRSKVKRARGMAQRESGIAKWNVKAKYTERHGER